MSKPVKEMIVSEYRRRFADLGGAVVVEVRGLDAGGTTRLRDELRAKSIRVSARHTVRWNSVPPVCSGRSKTWRVPAKYSRS